MSFKYILPTVSYKSSLYVRYGVYVLYVNFPLYSAYTRITLYNLSLLFLLYSLTGSILETMLLLTN